MFKRFIALLVCFTFITSYYQPVYAQDFNINQLPVPGSMIGTTPAYVPLTLKGMVIHPENALKFDFLMDTGHSNLKGEALSDEALKVMKYFLTALTIPEDDLWVNLSPYEKGRIIQDNFGQTIMGRDLLAEDYVLKQLTVSLIYPEKALGKEFWQQVYSKAEKEYGTTQIPVNTFNKVWIVPSEAVVWEHDDKVLIVKSHLKVMLEEDYLSLNKHVGAVNSPLSYKEGDRGSSKDINKLGSQIVRSIVLPVLEKEVNEGKNFAQLRQMYQAMILATWYKKALRESILNKVYADKKKVAGIGYKQSNDIELIYQQYLKAFKKGAFNYIKEDIDPATGQTVPRKYFSGGFSLNGKRTAFAKTVLTVLIGGILTLSPIYQKQAIAQTQGKTMIEASWQVSEAGSITQDAAMLDFDKSLENIIKHNKGDSLGLEFALGEYFSERNVKDLIELLDDSQKLSKYGTGIVQEQIITALGNKGYLGNESDRAIELLLKMLDDRQFSLPAAEALLKINEFKDKVVLGKLLSWYNEPGHQYNVQGNIFQFFNEATKRRRHGYAFNINWEPAVGSKYSKSNNSIEYKDEVLEIEWVPNNDPSWGQILPQKLTQDAAMLRQMPLLANMAARIKILFLNLDPLIRREVYRNIGPLVKTFTENYVVETIVNSKYIKNFDKHLKYVEGSSIVKQEIFIRDRTLQESGLENKVFRQDEPKIIYSKGGRKLNQQRFFDFLRALTEENYKEQIQDVLEIGLGIKLDTEAIPDLLLHLTHGNSFDHTVQLLKRFGADPDQMFKGYVNALNYGDQVARMKAANALGEMGNTDAIGPLEKEREALKKEYQGDKTKIQGSSTEEFHIAKVIEQLESIKETQEIWAQKDRFALVRSLKETVKDKFARKYIIDRLVALNVNPGTALLLKMLQDEEEIVRESVEKALRIFEVDEMQIFYGYIDAVLSPNRGVSNSAVERLKARGWRGRAIELFLHRLGDNKYYLSAEEGLEKLGASQEEKSNGYILALSSEDRKAKTNAIKSLGRQPGGETYFLLEALKQEESRLKGRTFYEYQLPELENKADRFNLISYVLHKREPQKEEGKYIYVYKEIEKGGGYVDEYGVASRDYWPAVYAWTKVERPADSAMLETPARRTPIDKATTAPNDLGGISLDAAMLNLQIKRDGNGVPLPISQQPLDRINIQGFVPQIISIQSVDLRALFNL